MEEYLLVLESLSKEADGLPAVEGQDLSRSQGPVGQASPVFDPEQVVLPLKLLSAFMVDGDDGVIVVVKIK